MSLNQKVNHIYKKLILLTISIIIFSLTTLVFLFFLKKTDFKKTKPVKNNSEKFIVAIGSEPRTLDPRKATDANGMRITDLLFQSLVRLGPNLEILPSAAQSWEYKNKTYTFTIDKNLKFSNGRYIKKEDLLFSFEEYKSNKNPFSSAFQIIDSINTKEQDKNFILTIQLKHDSAKFLSSDLPVLKILPREEILSNNTQFQKFPIGTGPFKLKSKTSSQIVLTTPKEPTTLQTKKKEVVFKIIRDNFTLFQKMLNGEIDIAQSEISFQKIKHFLDKKNKFQVFRQPGLSVTYLLINFKDECLKKKDIRKAINLSIDRLNIIQHKLNNFALPATTILGPNNHFFNQDLKNPSLDIQQATNIINQYKNCQQKTFSIKTSNAGSAVDHGKILALQLKKAGLKVNSESFEWGTFYKDLSDGRFQLALLKWVGFVDPDIYRIAFHSRELPPKGRNRSFYSNPDLDKLLDQGVVTMDRNKRLSIYHKVQKMIYNELVFIPLWHEKQIAVVQKNILNYNLHLNGGFYFLKKIKRAGL